MVTGRMTGLIWMGLLVLVVLVACSPPSTGDSYIMNGKGCPNKFKHLRDGASWGGCEFDVRPDDGLTPTTLMVTCGELEAEAVDRYESRPVWRSDEDTGLQVFWPGNRFACVKVR